MQDYLRKRVKIIKAFQNVSYAELASYIEISRHGFYNWLNGYYDLSVKNEKKLNEIIDILSE